MQMEQLMNLPLWQLTVAQFLNVMASASEKNTADAPKPTKEYVYGLQGLERLLNVSHVTAQRLKDGPLKKAVLQRGRKIMIDKELAIQLFNDRNA
jgi:hypothetical protein